MQNDFNSLLFEPISLPFCLYYSRLFTIGLSTFWGIILATFVSRAFDTLAVYFEFTTYLISQVLLVWNTPEVKINHCCSFVENFIEDYWLAPFKNSAFYFMHLNIVWISGILASLLCCLQFLAFGFIFVEPRWRSEVCIKIFIGFALLLASDIHSIIVITYNARRLGILSGKKPDPLGTGITKPLPNITFVALTVSGIFVLIWTTWRAFSALICANQVPCLFNFFVQV